MKKIILLSTLFISIITNAQNLDDAIRLSWYAPNGTARNMGIGGAMTSLGGDITANNINPAGIGLYKTNEFVFSPSYIMNNNKFSFRGNDTSSDNSGVSYGPVGWVWANNHRKNYSNWTSTAFSISINQLASFKNNIHYQGINNYSSFTEQYLEELARDNADTNAALGNYILGSSLAFRTFLIDTFLSPSGKIGYRSLVPFSQGMRQEYQSVTSGGIHEIAIAAAGNMEDKLYIGGSLNIPLIWYRRELNYSETDPANDTTNRFGYFNYYQREKSFGIGLGVKLGFIYKPANNWRIGLAIHTPQIISFSDQAKASLTANTESYAHTKYESSDNLNNGNYVKRSYSVLTPYHVLASASYFFNETADTRKQRGFISADIELVNYRGTRFYSNDDGDVNSTNYYRLINANIKNYYQPNVNFKLGGELKFDTWLFRLGGAYYGSPYEKEELVASRFVANGGIGYRNHGFFIDIAYAQSFEKNVHFAYHLNDVANTYATQSGGRTQLMLTFGCKF